MEICIGGMHRSGTSMVANLLHLCGLYLGDEADLVPADPANALGHWENVTFLTINNEILNFFGSKWYAPPRLRNGWADNPGLDEIRKRAELLLRNFVGKGNWGWKDPRNSLTLPFWKKLLPEMKVVICLRNPFEVAASLRARPVFKYSTGSALWNSIRETRAKFSLTRYRYFSTRACIRLWHTYNQQILEATTTENRIITHYGAYFRKPDLELSRVLNFLGLKTPEEVISRSSEMARLDLRHNRFRTYDLHKAALPGEVIALYMQMCKEAEFDPDSEDVAPQPLYPVG